MTWLANQIPSGQLWTCLSGLSSIHLNKNIKPYTGLLHSSIRMRLKNWQPQMCQQTAINQEILVRGTQPLVFWRRKHRNPWAECWRRPGIKVSIYICDKSHKWKWMLTGSDSNSQKPFQLRLSWMVAEVKGCPGNILICVRSFETSEVEITRLLLTIFLDFWNIIVAPDYMRNPDWESRKMRIVENKDTANLFYRGKTFVQPRGSWIIPQW